MRQEMFVIHRFTVLESRVGPTVYVICAQAEAAELLMEMKAVEGEQGKLQETVAALEAALKEARERGEAAAAQLTSQKEAAATLEKARAAAVQVITHFRVL